jgi:hypothetical protein
MPDVMQLEDRPIPIAYRGVFDYDKLYQTWVSWMRDNRMKYHETMYKDKAQQGGAREIEISCQGDVKVDYFNKWIVKLKLHIWDAFIVDVVQDGKNRKMMRGRLTIVISGSILRDFKGVYDVTPTLVKMRRFLLKLKKWEEGWQIWDTYYYKTTRLQGMLREVLGIDTSADAFGQ